MQKTRKPKKLWSFDNLSIQVLIALFAVGLVLVLVDVVLFAGIVLDGGFSWPWAAGSRPTAEVPVPTVRVWPAEAGPGALITVTGQGWQANNPLVVQLEAPSGICAAEVVATPNARQDGSFGDSFVFPPQSCWKDLPSILVVARSLQTEGVASTELQVVPAGHVQEPTATSTATPTTSVGPVVIEPTATPTAEPTATPTTEPTATPTTEPTATAEPTATPTTEPTATPTVQPTATPTVRPTATPVREPAITDWRAEYYANVNLSGSPVLVRNDRGPNGVLGLAFDWGQGAPFSGLQADDFSVRWTRTASFEEGLYRFRAVVDDGIRLYVDGNLVINEWREGSRREVAVDRRLTGGVHTLRVEYFERGGLAVAQVHWDKMSSYPEWKGEYWSNLGLQGNPVVVRNDANLAFDWGEGSPAGGIPSDGFSARWTRTVALDGGSYAFHVLVDDGVRVWLNDRKIFDAWSDHDASELRTNLVVAKGTYTIRVEYYERIGKARIQLWWEKGSLISSSDWKGEYWPNRDLSGDIVLVRNDRDADGTPGLDFNWGPNAPFLGMPADNWSARWTRRLGFDAGNYRFHVIADDGVRLWVDGKLLIDAWRDQEPRELTADRELSQGNHDLNVEYYEHAGGARIQLWWEKWSTPYPDWKAEFWANRDLIGVPVVTRNDRGSGTGGLDYDWGANAPAKKVPADDFSARWVREMTLKPGRYRLLAVADDGIRVYVDNELLIDEWHRNKAEQTYSVDLMLTGKHRIQVEYFEQVGNARLKVWWKRIGDLPQS